MKYISTVFASNQRSMFNFIKNPETDDLQAFQWFINHHGPDDGDLLTIDYLWNFFYEKGTDENTSLSGRSNLDFMVATILDAYPNNEGKLHDEERRVLKTILMMQAISQKLIIVLRSFVQMIKTLILPSKATPGLKQIVLPILPKISLLSREYSTLNQPTRVMNTQLPLLPVIRYRSTTLSASASLKPRLPNSSMTRNC